MIADAVVDAIAGGRTPKLEPFETLGVDLGLARRIIDLTKTATDPKV